MRKQRHFIIGFIGITSLLLLSSSLLSDSKLNLVKGMANVLSASSNTQTNEQIRMLERENADLRAKLNGLDYQSSGEYVVYSSYPFNNRSEIIIGNIEDSNAAVGDTIVLGNATLIGKIKQLNGDKAIVTTIFDPSFETSVRIGESSADALIQGGNSLDLSLIPNESLIEPGDIVYVSNQEFPYGLEIGTIEDIHSDGSGPFRTATVNPSFTISDLRHVGILN